MSKITLNHVANLIDATTAATTINNNSDALVTAFDNTLSRNGASPNSMSSSIDMNSNRVFNLPAPLGVTEPLRLQDLQDFNTNTVLPGTNISITGSVSKTISTVTTPTFTSVNKVAITAPASAATLTIANNKTLTANNTLALAGTDGTTLTFQGSDTYLGRATTDTITNKSISGATNTLSAIPLSASATQAANTLVANATGSSASPTAIDISALTTKASPGVGDYVLLSDQAASGALKKATVASVSSASGPVSSFNTLTGAVTSNVTVQKFTASGTYTPTAGMLHCIIEAVGSGGGGGGSTGGASQTSAGGGGGSGSYSRTYSTAAAIGASKAITIGAAGAGGGAGATGTAGGDCSLGALCVGRGGQPGGGGGVNAGGTVGVGGPTGTGDITAVGFPGTGGTGSSSISTAYPGSSGGSSFFGGGGASLGAGSSATGTAASNYGGGGAGGVSYASASNFGGGAGSTGIVIVTEFINL